MKKLIIFIAFAVLMIFVESCSFSTANLVDPKVCTSLDGDLCQQDNPVLSTNVNQLFASCEIKNAPVETKVKFTWFYYGETKIKIDEITFNTENKGTNLNLHSSLSRPYNGWPKGVYEIEMLILVDGKKPIIKQFSIE